MRSHISERIAQPAHLAGLKRKPGKRKAQSATPISITRWARLLAEQNAPEAEHRTEWVREQLEKG